MRNKFRITSATFMNPKRNQSLDVLRGLAIVGMILSGSIAFGDTMPAWMHHAQVPPPNFVFNPQLAGITWVDLVFPFFLFTMGAAMPLAASSKTDFSFLETIADLSKRFFRLAWFALFLEHVKPFSLANSPTVWHCVISVLGFGLLWLMYARAIKLPLKIAAFVVSVGLVLSLTYRDGSGFKLERNDIIILVLANMAFFGGLIYHLSKHNPWLRLAVLPFLLGLILANSPHGTGGMEGWQVDLTKFTPVKYLYNFNFLKYLFIVIPGTFAGDWIRQQSLDNLNVATPSVKKRFEVILLLILVLSLPFINLYGLFTRQVSLNLCLNLIAMAFIYFLIQRLETELSNFIKKATYAGMYLLLLGLTFETLQGGIKKDNATFSYFFVASGLAFFILLALELLEKMEILRGIRHFFKQLGQNPMVAYVAGSLLITPLLRITTLENYWAMLDGNPWLGLLKGITFTAAVAAVTILTVRKGWFWKT